MRIEYDAWEFYFKIKYGIGVDIRKFWYCNTDGDNLHEVVRVVVGDTEGVSTAAMWNAASLNLEKLEKWVLQDARFIKPLDNIFSVQ